MIYTSNSGPSWLSFVCLGKPWPVLILKTQFHQEGIKTLSNALQPHKPAVSVTVQKAWSTTWRSLERKNKHSFTKFIERINSSLTLAMFQVIFYFLTSIFILAVSGRNFIWLHPVEHLAVWISIRSKHLTSIFKLVPQCLFGVCTNCHCDFTKKQNHGTQMWSVLSLIWYNINLRINAQSS